ncbi:hypothetical protein ARMSODRAFT_1085004 [Armillaria solidipes]|uniref:Uncharacterized protein n=1 Tax=Armillaria solidipes TaxID=1076256 RepID=A0A2H3BZ01_9AGAR|nr:hypothetical protein ARMSODRAFT_1085004 [Armillaria solidipes]
MELPGPDALRKERTRLRNAIATFRKRKPDVTAEELRARYPVIPEAPRKKSKREIVARQRREGESDDAFQKRLRLAEQKRLQRAGKRAAQQSELDSGAPASGPSKRRKRAEEEVPLKVPDNPASPPRIPSSFIEAITSEASPSNAEKGIQTEIGMPSRLVTELGVSMPDDSSAPPDHVVLPCISEGPKFLLQPTGNHSSSLSDQASRDEKTIADLHKELQIFSKQMADSKTKISQLQATNEELSSKLQSCQTELKSTTTEICSLTKRLAVSEPRVSLLEEEKASIATNLQSLEAKLHSLKTVTDAQIGLLEGDKRSLIDQSEKTKAELDISQATVKILERRVGQLNGEFDELKKVSERNSIELKLWESNYKRSSDRCIKMSCTPELRATNKEANRGSTTALERSKSESTSLKGMLGTAERQITTFDEERLGFQIKIEELERQLSVLQKDHQTACRHNELLSDRALRCDQKLRVSEVPVATLQASKNEKEGSVVTRDASPHREKSRSPRCNDHPEPMSIAGQEVEVNPENRPLSPSMEKADLSHKSQANSCASQDYEAHRGQMSLVEATVPGFSSDTRGRSLQTFRGISTLEYRKKENCQHADLRRE